MSFLDQFAASIENDRKAAKAKYMKEFFKKQKLREKKNACQLKYAHSKKGIATRRKYDNSPQKKLCDKRYRKARRSDPVLYMKDLEIVRKCHARPEAKARIRALQSSEAYKKKTSARHKWRMENEPEYKARRIEVKRVWYERQKNKKLI